MTGSDDDPARGFEPTPDEVKNGWTRETLNNYLRMRAQQQNSYAAEQQASKVRKLKVENNDKYNPHHWT